MSPSEAKVVRVTALTVLCLLVMRLVAAAFTPLAFDEAYYWMWSQHPAFGYYDHPPMVALVIRLGTLIGGDTAFGVRVVSILLALPMSYAVYRSAELLFGGRRVASTAAILLNVTLIVSAGTMIVTPDAPLMVASSFVLLALAKVLTTGRGVWWLGVGTAVGAALLSKYTALFFGPAILIWLILTPRLRRWLISPWPYLGGVVAFAIFAPVILWNSEHQWVSFVKQLGRSRADAFRPGYFAELIPTQVAFATPLVFTLGVMGLYALTRRQSGALAARVLISCMVWVIVGYFMLHSLHNRVEANWFSPVYPAFAIAAAVAAHLSTWSPRAHRIARFSLRWAGPLGVLMFTALVVQANTGVLSGYRRDATVRSIGVGWREMAAEIDAIRARTGASCILAGDYGTTAWLTFYMPKGTCIAQYGERMRWTFMHEPDPALLKGKLLFIDTAGSELLPGVRKAYGQVEKVGEVRRKRGPLVIETDDLHLIEGPVGDVFDRTPPSDIGW